MSAQQSVSELFARLNPRLVKVVADHKDDEVKGGFTELPAFSTGVARLTRIEFYNDEGVCRFRAIGQMVAPAYGDGGVPLAGCETAQFAALVESDLDAGGAAVLDVVRKLVGQDKLDALVRTYTTPTNSGLLEIVAAVQAAATKDPIYFRCSNKFEENKNDRIDPKTGKPFPGRCWQRWQLAVPGYVPMTAVPPPATKPSANGHVAAPSPVPTQSVVTDPAPWLERKSPPPLPDKVESDEFRLVGGDEPDYDLLATMAEGGDAGACTTLYEAAAKLGYTDDDCVLAESYAQVAGWVRSGAKKGEAAVAGAPGPRVGGTVKYYPLDPKDPTHTRRLHRGVQCEIYEVDATDKTMSLRAFNNHDRTWAGVAWDDPNARFEKDK